MLFSANLLTNPGFETGTSSGWTTDVGSLQVRSYTVRTGSYSLGYGDNTYQASQVVDISAYATNIDAGLVTADLYTWKSFSGASEGDTWRVRLQYLNAANGVLAEYDSGVVSTPNTTYVQIQDIRVCPTNTRKLKIVLYGSEGGATNSDVYFDDCYAAISVDTFLKQYRRTRYPGSITGV